MKIVDSLPTGSLGLDKLLKGGIPTGNVVLITGGPGTGKTTFSLQYLLEGVKNGENSIFISLSQKPEEIIKYGKAIYPEEKLRQIKYIDFSPSSTVMSPYLTMEQDDIGDFGLARVKESILKITEEMADKYNRLVIDPLNAFTTMFSNPSQFRNKLLDFHIALKKTGLTTVIVFETIELDREAPISKFLADGVINMRLVEMGVRKGRALEILKMRGTDHDLTLTPFRIQEEGISVEVGSPIF